MATVTITLEDKENGNFDLSMMFDPEPEEGAQPTPAQIIGMEILDRIMEANPTALDRVVRFDDLGDTEH